MVGGLTEVPIHSPRGFRCGEPRFDMVSDRRLVDDVMRDGVE
jgi:hypothetical protein